ncbi:MAG: hypothetical protein J6S85_15300 [Methanobrevibacter sp.]|nr:hypothetical protein [Methanobrevibacter sp.]
MALEVVPFEQGLPFMFPLFAEEWKPINIPWKVGFAHTCIHTFRIWIHEEIHLNANKVFEEMEVLFTSPENQKSFEERNLVGAEMVFYYLYSKLSKVPVSVPSRRRFFVGIYFNEEVVRHPEKAALTFTGMLEDLTAVGSVVNNFVILESSNQPVSDKRVLN